MKNKLVKYFKKNKKLDVKIFTENPGLSQIPECQPKPAYHYFPDWFKAVPKNNINQDSRGTIKKCPIFSEYLTQGIIIPMWCDTQITVNATGNVTVDSADPNMKWDKHPDFQYLDFLPEKANSREFVTLKAISPWFIQTPKGYSSYQTPLYYHFNDYNILPGCINTDYHHQINQQIIVRKNSTILLERGDPFAWYIPYKRESYNFFTRLAHVEDKINLKRSIMDIQTKFANSYTLRLKQINKKRNKNA